jgi:hypothetical protein
MADYNLFYFNIEANSEQINYANKLVDYSIEHHSVKDIFAEDPNGKERQREFRFTGTLGEILFADTYKLPRPTKSFGAVDGQDNGEDFIISINGNNFSFDVKSMSRKSNVFRKNYVLNIPAYQINKEKVITDYYFCISISLISGKYVVSFLGFILRNDILKNKVGILYKKGTKRIKDDGTFFIFQRDTYEIDFKDIHSPFLDEEIKKITGFELKKLLEPIN